MTLNACGIHGFRGHGICEGCVREDERKKVDDELGQRALRALERIADALEGKTGASWTIPTPATVCMHAVTTADTGGMKCAACGMRLVTP